MKRNKYSNRKREKDPEENEEAEAEEEDRDDAEVVVLRDPLELFGMDIMLSILSFLDARSGVLSLLVSHAWNVVASSDRLWSSKCEELWLGTHAPVVAVSGIVKSRIMRDDLCDYVWEFHFNKAAPEYWRNLDPYWKGTGSLMHRYFHPDGSETADHGDEVWGVHESCYCTITSILENGPRREHYVRINRWPQMFVFRKQDWSWEMSNHLFFYTSIPDSDKAGGTGPLFVVR